MSKILVVGVYLANRPNTATHLSFEFAGSRSHEVVQRWVALAPNGEGRFDHPMTDLVVTDPTPKFVLLDQLLHDASEFDWVLLCDDDVEVGANFIDELIRLCTCHDFALAQPARTLDSFTDHPFVQILPGLQARLTRFVEIGPLTCIRRDAMKVLLPFRPESGMGWGLDFVWPVRMEAAGLRMGIVDAVPIAHRIRKSVTGYTHSSAHLGMCAALANERHLTPDEAFTVLEAYA